MKTKALIYCRVSGKKQVNEGNGLSSQEKVCRDYAKNTLGIEVEKVFNEEGVSGGIFERKSIKELLEYIDTNRKNSYIVIFEDLNRLSRDIQVHHLLKSEFRKRGVELCCPNFEFEESPEGIFRENMNVSMAQYEKDKNKERVLKRIKARLEQGFWCFKVPIGYKYSSNKKGGKRVLLNENNYEIVKKGLEKFANDELLTLRDLTNYFAKYNIKVGGMKAGRVYHGEHIMATISNILYTGYLKYPKWNIGRTKAKHEAIISLETHEKILKKVEKFRKKTDSIEEKIEENRNRVDNSEDFPLRGFLYCEESKLMMSGGWAKGEYRKYPYYTYPLKSPLSQSTIKRDKLHEEFEKILETIQPKGELLDLFREASKIAQNELEKEDILNKKNGEKEIQEIDKKMQNYIERIGNTKSNVLIKNYEEEIEKLDLQKQEILEKLKESKKQVGTFLEDKIQLAKNALIIWKNGDLNLRKDLVKNIFPYGIPINKKKQVGTPALSLFYQVLETGKNGKNQMVGMARLELATSTLSV